MTDRPDAIDPAEILARRICPHAFEGEGGAFVSLRNAAMTDARFWIGDLEARGLRIVDGATQAMMAEALNDNIFGSLPYARSALLGIAKRVFKRMLATAPTWGTKT